MGTEANQSVNKRGPAKRVDPVFITKTEISQHFGIGDTSTIDSWISKGEFPPAHSRPGGRFVVWLRKHWNFYVEKGAWPKDAWPDRKTRES